MKNYISLITDQEFEYVCHAVGGKNLRKVYAKCSNTFNKLKRGFRPGNLTDEQTFEFAATYKEQPFLIDYFNYVIGNWLNEISEKKKERIKSGEAEEIALIETLSQSSLFNEKPELYLKLNDTKLTPENTTAFCYAVRTTAERNKLKETIENSPSEIPTKEEHLSVLCKKQEAELKKLQKNHEEALKSSEEEKQSLANVINQLKNELDYEIEANKMLKDEIKNYSERATFQVKSIEAYPSEGFLYSSLCMTYVDEKERKRLIRLADIIGGKFSERFLEDSPEYKYLFRPEDSIRSNFIGVWDWKTIENPNNPEHTFIHSKFKKGIIPIEVYEIKSCNTIQNLLKAMKDGINAEFHTDRIMFSYSIGYKFKGIYCSKSDLIFQDGKAFFRPNLMKLPVFDFYGNDILYFEQAQIMAKIDPGIPSEVIDIRTPMEIVQNCIINRATWSALQQRGFIRNEYKLIKDFLTDLPSTDLYEEISSVCSCDVVKAKKLIEEFIHNTDTIVTGKTFENDVAAQIIRNDETLYKECMSELENDWKSQNSDLIKKAQESFERIKKEEELCLKICDEKRDEYNQLEKELKKVQEELSKQEQLAKDVEERVLEKIEQARNNAAEFIAENAFIHINRAEKQSASMQHFILSKEFITDDPDKNSNSEEVLFTVQNELVEAGVGKKASVSMSALLYASYVNRIPILLAGPNGTEIAKAFSISLNCRLPAVLRCQGSFSSQAIDECVTSSEDIVVIEQPFQSEWQNSIVKLLEQRDKFYIITHPFAEDLVVEPRGLFDYCIPVLTDLLVESVPKKDYVGGVMTQDFKQFIHGTENRLYEKALTAIRAGTLTKRCIQRLISDMHKLLEKNDTDADYQLLLYPLAYVLGELNSLSKVMENESNLSKKTLDILSKLIGE